MKYTTIRPGFQAGDPQVKDIRALRYENYPQLHQDELSIIRNNINDVISMLSAAPREDHYFYLNLKHF